MCVCARARVCVHVCVCTYVCVHVCVRTCVCMLMSGNFDVESDFECMQFRDCTPHTIVLLDPITCTAAAVVCMCIIKSTLTVNVLLV